MPLPVPWIIDTTGFDNGDVVGFVGKQALKDLPEGVCSTPQLEGVEQIIVVEETQYTTPT